MSKKTPPANSELTDDDKTLLREIFSGTFYKRIGIGITPADALASVTELDASLDPDSPQTTLSVFLNKVGGALADLDSPAVKAYGEHMLELVKRDIAPTRDALGSICKTLQTAIDLKEERDPDKRRKVAAALRKVPAAIDYVVGQLDLMSDEFHRMQAQMPRDEAHVERLHGHNLPEALADDHQFVNANLENISEIFRRFRGQTHDFRSHHVQIKELATQMEKDFLQPPRQASETIRSQ